MQQENREINGTGVTNKATVMQQSEWLDSVISHLQKFKEQVNAETIVLEGGYFDRSLNMPEKESFRLNELRLSVGYHEIK